MSILTKYLRLLMPVAAVALSTASTGAAVTIKASIDSTTVIQGSKASLQLQVLQDGTDGILIDAPQPGKEYFGVEISDVHLDTIDHGNGRMEMLYNYTIQAFDPSTVTLPPFRYATGGDTLESDVVTLKVLEVDLDSLTDINPMYSVTAIPSRWYDFIPSWWIWVLAGIFAVGLVAIIYLLVNRKKIIAARPVKVTPPYDLAVMRLNDLQAKKLPQSGRDKEYYTELTEILRQYLEGRFGINAMEMTSSQIVSALRHNKDTKPGSDLMRQILEIADFVKFAKVRPLPDDNVKAFNSAIKFVEDSKPQPDPEPAENEIKTHD